MLLTELEARNFRNVRGKIACGTGLNILQGENGQGKTNWLEAIFFLASAASFRTSRPAETVLFGENEAFLRGIVKQSEGLSRELSVSLNGNSKILAVNGKRVSLPVYRNELHAVVFNADSLDIVRGGPEHRRKFLDESISAVHPPYVRTLSDYSRIIRQKNALLQSALEKGLRESEVFGQLEPWNMQLTGLASKIYKSRLRIVERLNEALAEKPFSNDSLSIRYLSSLEGKGNLEDYEYLLAERLKLRLQAELLNGHSLIGPHRDDLEITINGFDARRFASAGQQRTAVISLMLANISIFHSQKGEYPLFLIDDIDSELDYNRIGSLLGFLKGKTQTFITTSKTGVAEQYGRNAEVFTIKGGQISSGRSKAA